MAKGILVGFGILILSLCSIIIPIAHFVTVPGGPFFAGFVGIGHVKKSSDSYGIKGMKFGSLLGLFVLLVTGIAAAVVMLTLDTSPKVTVIMWFGVTVFTLYTGSMATLGAMYSSMRAGRTADRIADPLTEEPGVAER